MIRVLVQRDDFSPGAELAALAAGGDPGAVASFIGHVRGREGLATLELEHYPRMTQAALEAIARDAHHRFGLTAATVIHRHGTLAPGERIVLAAAASAHRAAALDAVAFLMDWLKTRAPFWKRETLVDGTTRWVAPRAEDTAAAARWSTP